MYDYLVVGSGLYGAIFAHEAKNHGKSVLVVDKRPNIAGNIYTESVEGINVHKYGAHIFHTNNKKVWSYITQFAEFNRFTNSPVANYKGELYSLPFNMYTFNKMWGVVTPEEDAARSLVQLLDFGATMEAFRIDQDYYVVKFTVPKKFVGYFVNELNMDEEFHLKVIALKRANSVTNCLGISLTELHVKNELPGDEKVEEGDELVCYGKYRDFQSFWKAI